uniref:OB domain-containing protein n=1 Tax=Oryza meridionalis TaxID=40149 RepID=A0A0E0ED58_9ORYZ
MTHQGPDAPGVSGISSASTVKLKDLVSAATNNMNTTFIVLDKAARAAPPPPPHSLADAREETCLALVADETAALHFLLWGAERDAFEPGDIVWLTGGIFSYHRSNNLVLRAGRHGRTEKVGECTMLFVETPNMSEVKWARDPGDPRRMVQEAVVSPHSQVFKPLQ